MIRCAECGKKFDPFQAEVRTIAKKRVVQCPHCKMFTKI